MALGSFFLVIDDAKVLKRAVYANIDSAEENIPKYLTDNEILRIRMGHSDKKFVTTLLPDYQIFSYKKEIDVKRRIITLVGGVILLKDVNANLHKDAVQMFVEKIVDYYEKSEEDLLQMVSEKHSRYFDQPQIILDAKEIERRLTERVKNLNRQGKFDDANQLLDKIKKIPRKLYKAHENAEEALKSQDFTRAEREFETAMKYADELEENSLVKMYKEKIRITQKIPELLKTRDNYVEIALTRLKNNDFEQAQEFFKRAAEVSEDLLDSRHAEEYGLKAKALAEYVLVDKKFKT